jgi:uncharacterized protein (TIGR03435 family)
MRALIIIGLTISVQLLVFGQGNPATFEVTSVKPSAHNRAPGSTGIPSVTPSGLMRATDQTLRLLLLYAFELRGYELRGPTWLADESYDIEAKMPDGVPSSQMRLMLQNLLVDRFQISSHWETQSVSGFAMVVSNRDRLEKLRKSDDDTGSREQLPRLNVNSTGRLTFRNATLDAFAKALSGFLEQPVFDTTDTKGVFDLDFKATLRNLPEPHTSLTRTPKIRVRPSLLLFRNSGSSYKLRIRR